MEVGIARMFGVAKLSGRLPNIPEVVPSGFRKVTCLLKATLKWKVTNFFSVGFLI